MACRSGWFFTSGMARVVRRVALLAAVAVLMAVPGIEAALAQDVIVFPNPAADAAQDQRSTDILLFPPQQVPQPSQQAAQVADAPPSVSVDQTPPLFVREPAEATTPMQSTKKVIQSSCNAAADCVLTQDSCGVIVSTTKEFRRTVKEAAQKSCTDQRLASRAQKAPSVDNFIAVCREHVCDMAQLQ